MLFFQLFIFFVFGLEPTALPKWEAGAGFFYADLADYPGSDETTVRSFPLPYFVYRGDIVQADRDGGIRTRFLKNVFYELDFSFSGAFPADSKDNLARQGMPDLHWMFELGPRLKLHLYRSKVFLWQFQLPVRAVFDLDSFDIRDQGYTFTPNFRFIFPKFPFEQNTISFSYNFIGASTKTHAYFYDVDPEYVTSDRPAYRAEKGELGRSYRVSLVSRWKNLSVFLGAALNDYQRAKNKESPLHRADFTRSYFVGFVYSAFQSEKQASR